MNDTIARLRECEAAADAARETQRLEVERCSKHATSVASDIELLELQEKSYADSAIKSALGHQPSSHLLDAQTMEELRAKIRVADIVTQQLEMRKRNSSLAVIKADRELKAAKADFLQEIALSPALQSFHEAFDTLGQKALLLMAAHRTIYTTYKIDDVQARSFLDLYGPAAELINDLRNLTWPNKHRYDVKPQWLEGSGRFYPDELPGMGDATFKLESLITSALSQ